MPNSISDNPNLGTGMFGTSALPNPELARALAAIARSASTMGAETSTDGVLRAATATLRDSFGATLARTWIHDADDGVLELRASAGLSDSVVGSRARVEVGRAPCPVTQVAATRTPFVHNQLPGDQTWDQRWIEREGIVSVAAVPLLVGYEVEGVVALFRREPISAPLLDNIEAYAGVIATAVAAAGGLERERAGRAETEAARRRATFLADAGAALTTSLDEATAIQQLGQLFVPQLADWCAFDMVGGDGVVRRSIVAGAHDSARGDAAAQLAGRFPADPDDPSHPIARTLRTGLPELVPVVDDAMVTKRARNPQHLALLRAMGVRSYMIVPLIARGRTLGTVSLVIADSARAFGPDDLQLADALAVRAALAVDNARLVHQARTAEERARQQALRLAVLAEASHAFAASLDLPAVLDVVARRIAEAVGDGCIIRLVSDDGQWFVPAAAYHPDPTAIDVLWRILRATPHPIGEGLVGQVAASGEPLLIPWLSPAEMREQLKPEFRPFLDQFGLRSALIVPLSGSSRLLGAIMTWRGDTGSPYTIDDQVFLQSLADRAAVAIDNAKLYREQVEARTRIQALAAERAAVLGHIADGVIIADPHGRIVFVNDAAERLHGRAVLGVGVDRYSEVYHLLTEEGERFPASDLPLARAVERAETIVSATWRIQRPDGSEVIVTGSAAPVLADDGTCLGAVLTMRDVTAERALERQKDEFYLAASHDLKTPLTSIKGWAQLLRGRAERDADLSRDLTAVTAIETQAQGMQQLIDDLLLTARSQPRSASALAVTDVDLAALSERLVAHYRPLAARHALTIAAEGPVWGRWDAGKLEQIVGNLVANAIKYSPNGGAIRVVVSQSDDEARLTVSDEGIGIPPDQLPRVFDRYFRVERGGRDAGIEGSGIGLFSARRLAELHGGRLDVESVHGSGSTFSLVLPLRS